MAFAESRVCGQPSLANVDVLLDSLRQATDGCLQDHFSALVTLPLQKSVINDAGIPFTGHTEFLAELTGIARPVMLLVAGDLRIALASNNMTGQVIPVAFAESRVCGQPSLANVDVLLDSLRQATDGCLQDHFSALVTLPLQKSVINDAGIPFTGHTEFLAELTGIARPVMLLVAGDLRIALASTHMPLREVPDYLTGDTIREVLQVLHSDLKTRFRLAEPEIVVCGLNPHAGEGGHLGTEDNGIIAPVIHELANRGLNIRGPLPADTAFTPAAGPRDASSCMTGAIMSLLQTPKRCARAQS